MYFSIINLQKWHWHLTDSLSSVHACRKSLPAPHIQIMTLETKTINCLFLQEFNPAMVSNCTNSYIIYTDILQNVFFQSNTSKRNTLTYSFKYLLCFDMGRSRYFFCLFVCFFNFVCLLFITNLNSEFLLKFSISICRWLTDCRMIKLILKN